MTQYTARLIDWLGVGGVYPGEVTEAIKVDRWFRLPMLLLALCIPIQWYLSNHGYVALETERKFNWLIWFAFVAETASVLYYVEDKKRYLLSNWINLLVISSIIPLFFWTESSAVSILFLVRLLIIPRVIITWWTSN